MFQCSSASRKFLNYNVPKQINKLERFQCSSASRKFLNFIVHNSAFVDADVSVLFSEPKIPQFCLSAPACPYLARFQCSSASRKFLNYRLVDSGIFHVTCFSALQRAENSSMLEPQGEFCTTLPVSVLFSEPKIPQLQESTTTSVLCCVSVLFSEPKIPQYMSHLTRPTSICWFQCSSASRKFLNTETSHGSAR